ncbi:MAG: hypothetical protein WEC75_11435 [Dehalococcoidia bacterium]
MTTATAATHTQLNRAYVQSKVIEANLEHLRVVLLDANADLRDGLKPFTHSFGQYVRSLSEACTVAEADERASGVNGRKPATAAVVGV